MKFTSTIVAVGTVCLFVGSDASEKNSLSKNTAAKKWNPITSMSNWASSTKAGVSEFVTHAKVGYKMTKGKATDEEKADFQEYLVEGSRPSIEWYQKKMVEDAEEWEYLGYDVREKREAAEGFEFLSPKVQEQQRKAFASITFMYNCNEFAHTPGIDVTAEQKTDAYRKRIDTECKTKANKCVNNKWAQYISTNEDYLKNMPGMMVDPIKYIPGNPLIFEPCNTLSNAAFYQVADVDNVRATKTSKGDEHMQQAAANLAFGSFYYHGWPSKSTWEAGRFSDVVAMDYAFLQMFEQLIVKVCASVECANKIIEMYLKGDDRHGRQGMSAKSDEVVKSRMLKSLDEWGQKGKGFESKYLTAEFARTTLLKSDYMWCEETAPKYTTAVTGIVMLWLRATFSSQIPHGRGDVIFKQVSSAVIEALVTKKEMKVGAIAIRDAIAKLDLKVVYHVPQSYKVFTKMITKFMAGMHFQEVKAGPSLMQVFGRYDTCPFVPHSNWHRQAAQLIRLILKGIVNDLDKAGLRRKLSNYNKMMMYPKLLANIPSMGSETLAIVNIARLGLEPTLHKDGFDFQVKVAKGLREAIQKKINLSKRPLFLNHAHHLRRRRRLLSTKNALQQRAVRAGAEKTEMAGVFNKKSKLASSMRLKKKKKRDHKTYDWNDDYRNVCGLGPLESTTSLYDNFVPMWILNKND